MSSSTPPSSIIKLDQIHQNLQQICSNITQDLETKLQSTDVPITIDRAWLLNRVSENLQSSYHVVSNDAPTANEQIDNANTKLLQGLGSLRRLPRELRETIYADLISSGSVAITAVSKIINSETADVVSKQGVFRTKVGHRYHRTAYRPVAIDALISTNVARVQNVDIRVNSIPTQVDHNEVALEELAQVLFGAPQTSMCRKRCCVAFELQWEYCLRLSDHLENLKDLKRFTGFEEFVFVLARDLQKVMEGLEDWQRAKLLGDQTRAMEVVEEKLVPDFGDVVWREEERVYRVGSTVSATHDFEIQLEQHASAVAQSDKDALNCITSPDPVDLNCLAHQVRETFINSHQIMPFTNEETIRQDLEDSHEKHMQGLGALRRLPGELRVPIFTDVLAAGSMEIMRVSKAVNREASPVLHANGVCRLNLGFEGTKVAGQYPELDSTARGFSVDRIQNVTFVINAAASKLRRSMRHHDYLRVFAESRTKKKYCRVVFKCSLFFADLAVREVLHAVRRYTQFEQVDVKLAIYREQDMMDELRNLSWPSWEAFQFGDKKMEALDLVKNMLSPSLGNSGLFEEDGSTLVTFRPSKHGAVRSHEANPGTGFGVDLDVEANDEDGFEEIYEAYEDEYIQRHSGSSQG